MNLLEHEAKTLLSKHNIPLPASQLVNDQPLDLPMPVVLKSQVPVGGRGKAGGILLVNNAADVLPTSQQLLQHPIKGHLPTVILAEQALTIQKEFYLSLLIDRTEMAVQLVAHINGGVEVESQQGFKKWTIPYGALDADMLGQALADYYDLPDQTFVLQDLVENLYACFTQNDATLLEINPLILTSENELLAGDCKIILDDAAAFRHDWQFSANTTESNFVTINQDGDTATIANGAGLAMATVDAAYDAGLTPANFLDIGGGANAETLLAAFKQILEYPNVRVIVINIFAGITRSDEVARAIITAKQQLDALPPLFIRLAGTNHDEAVALLTEQQIAIEPTLESCLQKAKVFIG